MFFFTTWKTRFPESHTCSIDPPILRFSSLSRHVTVQFHVYDAWTKKKGNLFIYFKFPPIPFLTYFTRRAADKTIFYKGCCMYVLPPGKQVFFFSLGPQRPSGEKEKRRLVITYLTRSSALIGLPMYLVK